VLMARLVELRGARIGISRGWDRLRGVVIDHGQLMELAPELAAQLGLEVRSADE
jgi:hypothetical protein